MVIYREELNESVLAYANLIAVNRLLNQKNVMIPPIPESYWKDHKQYFYKTEEKNRLYKTIKFYLEKISNRPFFIRNKKFIK